MKLCRAVIACDYAFRLARGVPRQRVLREQLTLRRLLRAETARLDATYPPAPEPRP